MAPAAGKKKDIGNEESVENVLKSQKYIKTEEQAINFLWEEINNRGL